jgi:hypothetical protein
MERRKLEGAALFMTVLGAMLIMPPLATVFQLEQRIFGLPVVVIYLFLVWAGLLAGGWWLSRRLPHEPGEGPADGDEP